MKPQHQLMLRKVGKGKMFSRMKPEMKTHEMSETKEMKELEQKMEGCSMGSGLKKAMSKSVAPPKRKPLKFKL